MRSPRRVLVPLITLIGLALLGLVLLAPPSIAERQDQESPELSSKQTRTIVVNCRRGGRVARALARPGEELRIEVRGMCEESIVIERDRVTLAGRDPQRDGLVGVEGVPNTVMIRGGVFDVRIESLSILGPTDGGAALGTGASFRASVVDSRVEGRGGIGAFIGNGSFLFMQDSTVVTDGGTSALWVASGTFNSVGLTVADLGGEARAVTAAGDSTIRLTGAVVEGGLGIQATNGAFVNINGGSEIRVVPDGGGVALRLIDAGARVSASTVEGAMQVTNGGELTLIGVTQNGLPGPAGNRIGLNSFVHSLGETSLLGDLGIDGFSKAVVEGSLALEGALSCDPASHAMCLGALAADSSSCELCPLP